MVLYGLMSALIACIFGCHHDKHDFKAGESGSIGLEDSVYNLYYIKFRTTNESEGVILWREKPGSIVVFGQDKTLNSINGRQIEIGDLNKVNFIDKDYTINGSGDLGIKYEKDVLKYKDSSNLIPIIR